jgi:predicted double-glycine peptidase
MFLGVAGVALSVIAADKLPRSANGYLLSAAIPLVTAVFFRCEISRVTRTGLACATLAATFYSGWMEFLGPALCRPALAKLTTNLDRNGICHQTTGYTCGPAAAVTALRRIGFSAEEGDLALRAHCSLFTGTDPSDLAAAIDGRFGPSGARAQSRPMETLAQLAQAGLALTVIKLDGNLDHWVVVLEMDEHKVHFADPMQGLRVQSRAEFERVWEHETIRIWRDETGRKS